MGRSKYKIGLTGTHSTGKTSFLNNLASALRGHGFSVGRVGDLAESAHRLGFGILREHTWESTLWIITRGISCELEESLRSDVVLVDRAVPDALAYLRAALHTRGATIDTWQKGVLEDFVRGISRTYDVLLKTEIDPALGIQDDNRRDTDPVFRQLVDEKLDEVYAELGIECRPLSTAIVDGVLNDLVGGILQDGRKSYNGGRC